ncbi:MAG: hypothetical protein M0P19_06085 [Nevskia sp.]|jgi:hypothetical protein|nr:hypothetical protein [Nevskia sp.]MCK9385070.1 hypothetical protein [Nevskia sp.]
MSDWLDVLREACKASGQPKIAQRIGYSTAVVNATLKGSYKGDLQRVQTAVEGALMGQTVECPVLSAIPRQRCAEHQRAPFSSANPQRVQLYSTCPTCSHNLSGRVAAGGKSS